MKPLMKTDCQASKDVFRSLPQEASSEHLSSIYTHLEEEARLYTVSCGKSQVCSKQNSAVVEDHPRSPPQTAISRKIRALPRYPCLSPIALDVSFHRSSSDSRLIPFRKLSMTSLTSCSSFDPVSQHCQLLVHRLPDLGPKPTITSSEGNLLLPEMSHCRWLADQRPLSDWLPSSSP